MHEHPGLRAAAQRAQRRDELVDAPDGRVLAEHEQLPPQRSRGQQARRVQGLGVMHVRQRELRRVVAQHRALRRRRDRAPRALCQSSPQRVVARRRAAYDTVVVHYHCHAAHARERKDRGHGLPVLRHLRALHRHLGAGQHHRHRTLQRPGERRVVRRRLGSAEQHVDADRRRASGRHRLDELRMQTAWYRRRLVERREAGLVEAHHDHPRLGAHRRRQAVEQVVLETQQRRPDGQCLQQDKESQREEHPPYPGLPGVGVDWCPAARHRRLSGGRRAVPARIAGPTSRGAMAPSPQPRGDLLTYAKSGRRRGHNGSPSLAASLA